MDEHTMTRSTGETRQPAIEFDGRRWRDDQRFEDYGAFYQEVYGFTGVEVAKIGRVGATLVRAEQGPGDWSDAPTPALVIGALPRGRSVNICGDFGAKRFRSVMRPGSSIVMAPHMGGSIQMDESHICLALAIPYAAARELAGDDAALPPDGDFGHLHAGVVDDQELTRVVDRLWTSRSGANGLYADGLILQALGLLVRRAGQSVAPLKGGLAPWQERRAVEHLHAHLADDVTLVELAELTGLSTFHFARAFKQSTGAPPHAYLRGLRHEKARRLLAETGLSVTEIALEVGYDSGQALARAFRRETGVSPGAYRRERRA